MLGVSLRAAYGATEFGAPLEFDLVKRAPEDWIYIEFPDNIRYELVAQNDQDGTFELVMLVGQFLETLLGNRLFT
jgi:hypothetical protein